MNMLHKFLRRFAVDESGNSTIEFVIVVPVFFFFFLSSFELGIGMTRQVMLDRTLDLTVRELRLGRLIPATHDNIKQEFCDRALMIPDCENQVRLEMRPIDPRAWGNIPNNADCVDRSAPGVPPREFDPGTINELMILRACVLYEPYIPSSAMGAVIPRESGDAYALVSIASYVIEPN